MEATAVSAKNPCHGVVIALKAPALLLPYCWVAGFAFFMTALYGVVRSALKG